MNRREFAQKILLAGIALPIAGNDILANTNVTNNKGTSTLINAYYFRAHMYTLVPRHVREDLKWMADVGTNVVTLSVLEQDLFAATKNIEFVVNEASKLNMKVWMVPARWGGLFAGAPKVPEVAVNNMVALLFKMENMMNFPAVENYKITLDPRMPGMGNHSSPNNVDLSYDAASQTYMGKLSLTMTGYWKLNLKLLNETGEIVKGEAVTEENFESSLFFEIEF